MMKRAIWIVAGLLMCNLAMADGKIVFVDLQELFTRFYKTQLAQDQIRQQTDEMKLEQDIMKNEIEEIREEVEQLRADSRDPMLSTQVRSNKRVLLEERLVKMQEQEQEMLEYEQLRKKQIDEQNTRMTKKLFDEIQDNISSYSKEKGYKAVIDRSAQSRLGIQVINYVSISADITANVLAELNEGYEGITSENTDSGVNP
tara:strand:+ start:6843 stop:7445 length:603 start_codon:yes stop_codon:yes gene_type:complete